MKISYNWLKDYVEVKIPAQKLAEKLTMAGLEVTSLEEKLGDWILEIEITSNRPDLLSAIGIAREVAAITAKKLKLPNIPALRTPRSKLQTIQIEIQDKKDCPLYSARLIKDVKVNESPNWLKQKLEAVGIRPVNNIVDITNFCLMESGQPLHAFDFDKISDGKIVVRRAKQGEIIKTIDAEERKLTPEVLVIADSQNPVAVAGVMGAVNTEVTFGTKNILLESAYFNPALIRKAARILGITSESSYRFERSVDLENVLPASDRAVNLIQDLAGGVLISSSLQQTKTQKTRQKINLSLNCAEDLLGVKISGARIKQILTGLQFKVSAQKNYFSVQPPSFRQDIKQDVDLIEEISRINGFETLPLSSPAIKISQIEAKAPRILNNLTREFFAGIGFYEIISYNLISRKLLAETNLNSLDLIAIENPLSNDQEILSPSLIPGMLAAIKNNLNHNIKDLKLFEIGKNYSAAEENYALCLAMAGEKYPDWLRGSKEKINFFDLKGAVEALLDKLGISKPEFAALDFPVFAKAAVLKINEEKIGILGEIADSVLINWDIKQRGIFLAEINLEKLIKFVNLQKKFIPAISFPSVKRDISLVVKEDIPAKNVFAIAWELGGDLLKDIKLADLYTGGQIPKGFKGLTLSLEYQAKNRTLTDSQVNALHEAISQSFLQKLQAKIR